MARPEDVLMQFQCDHIRMMEETFAQTLSEREDVRLFFINENHAFTDGKNIVVDPAIFNLYADDDALLKTGKFLGWSQNILGSTWNALSIITRALSIHECLHILYTDFPCRAFSDPICDTINKLIVMSKISNIIEDAYIEAVGCTNYDNMEFYLKFMRVSQLFLSKAKPKKVINLKQALAGSNDILIQKKPERTNLERLKEYMGAMVDFLLYPWGWDESYNKDIAKYVEATKQLFMDGSAAPSPAERYSYCQKIFDIIQNLIPDDEEPVVFDNISKLLIGSKTHDDEGGIAGNTKRQGKSQEVNKRLFTDIKGNTRNSVVNARQIKQVLTEMSRNENSVKDISGNTGNLVILSSDDTGASPVHKYIKINQNHPKINYTLRKAYKNIYSKYATSIRSYNSRFEQLLQAHATVREDGLPYGSGIASKRLGDPHKKYWYKQQEGTDIPDVAVMLLVDGSGSMDGPRIKSAMETSVILHEVLKHQNIPHAIVEHRADGRKSEVDINILVDFDSKEDDKLNIMQLKAGNDNRDGLALYWAENYIHAHSQNEYKLIIVLSDGLPAHDADNYYPPVSVQDTANAVRAIKKRGTDIVAISLDDKDSFECYSLLSQIYPNLIACNDLSRLTGQLLNVIAKLFI